MIRALPEFSASVHPTETNGHWPYSMMFTPLGEPFNDAVAFRHNSWKRRRALVYEALQRCGTGIARTNSFSQCGSHAYVLRSVDGENRYRIAGSTCHDRFCTPCANERSRTIALNACDYINGEHCRFITLTIKTGGTALKPMLDKLTDAFTRLRRTPVWRESVTGGVAFLELKWNGTSKRWHPHLHCLVKGQWIAQRKLSEAWKAITHDSFVVDVRLVKSQAHAVRYVSKYASKPLNSSFVYEPHLLDEAVKALRGKRLCVTFGDCRGLCMVSKPSEESWENLGSLTSLAYDAACGDARARQIIADACGEAGDVLIAKAETDRAPPTAEPIQWHQQTLWSAFAQSLGVAS